MGRVCNAGTAVQDNALLLLRDFPQEYNKVTICELAPALVIGHFRVGTQAE